MSYHISGNICKQIAKNFFEVILKQFSIFRQHCALSVPSLMISEDQMTSEMKIEAAASYRLVYELLLPYILPIVLLGE